MSHLTLDLFAKNNLDNQLKKTYGIKVCKKDVLFEGF